MCISGAQFEEHCFNISRDILYPVFRPFEYAENTFHVICTLAAACANDSTLPILKGKLLEIITSILVKHFLGLGLGTI